MKQGVWNNRSESRMISERTLLLHNRYSRSNKLEDERLVGRWGRGLMKGRAHLERDRGNDGKQPRFNSWLEVVDVVRAPGLIHLDELRLLLLLYFWAYSASFLIPAYRSFSERETAGTGFLHPIPFQRQKRNDNWWTAEWRREPRMVGSTSWMAVNMFCF